MKASGDPFSKAHKTRASLLHLSNYIHQGSVYNGKIPNTDGTRGSDVIACSRWLGRLKLNRTRRRIDNKISSIQDGAVKRTVVEVLSDLKTGHLGASTDAVRTDINVVAARMARYQREIEKRKKLMSTFKKRVRFLITLTRVWKIHKLKMSLTLPTYGSLHDSPSHDIRTDLLFDLSEFRATQEAGASSEMKRILSTKPSLRTEQDIHHVQVALRNYKIIAQYPVSILRRLASRAWIESYTDKRIIVREGHPPMCFYVILSGSASRSKGAASDVTANSILQRGDVFEDFCMIHGTQRTYTVISRETIELLCVTNNDFVDIFMAGGLGKEEITFLRSVSAFQNWPVHRLLDTKPKATFSYFVSGKVLVKDSQQNDWIYVVKTGSCKVLKKLAKKKVLRKNGSVKVSLPLKVKQGLPKIDCGKDYSKSKPSISTDVQLGAKYRQTLRVSSLVPKIIRSSESNGKLTVMGYIKYS